MEGSMMLARFLLCGKVLDGEIQFKVYQSKSAQFTPWADSLRRELLDSLRVQFGPERVRECEWHAASVASRSGCPPLRQRVEG
jgi:hypothetical protein